MSSPSRVQFESKSIAASHLYRNKGLGKEEGILRSTPEKKSENKPKISQPNSPENYQKTPDSIIECKSPPSMAVSYFSCENEVLRNDEDILSFTSEKNSENHAKIIQPDSQINNQIVSSSLIEPDSASIIVPPFRQRNKLL